MKLNIETSSYNERRYGKPYIGKLNASDGRVASWGTWIGTPGSSGILEIEAEPGSIIIKGQKDSRGNNGTPDYAIVMDDGSLDYMGKAEAVKAARKLIAEKPAEPTLADILKALGVTTTTDAINRINQLTA